MARLLAPAGYMPAAGARPDSPGVFHDAQRGRYKVPAQLLRKQLYVCPDPGAPTILHIRLHGSPFARHTLLLRDWLRAHPTDRHRYQQLKNELAARHAGDADYDDLEFRTSSRTFVRSVGVPPIRGRAFDATAGRIGTWPRLRGWDQCSEGAYEIPMTRPSGESTRATV
jgi:hypothetical protein